MKILGLSFSFAPLAIVNMAHNKLLLFVPATKSVASTGRAAARRKAKCYAFAGWINV